MGYYITVPYFRKPPDRRSLPNEFFDLSQSTCGLQAESFVVRRFLAKRIRARKDFRVLVSLARVCTFILVMTTHRLKVMASAFVRVIQV